MFQLLASRCREEGRMGGRGQGMRPAGMRRRTGGGSEKVMEQHRVTQSDFPRLETDYCHCSPESRRIRKKIPTGWRSMDRRGETENVGKT
jgi:hypothetical protein